MQYKNLQEISNSELSHYAWIGLSRFQNVSYTTNLISELHEVSSRFKNDVLKQAEQIRYCIGQAKEYFRASEVVSISTKPLLLYYGLMSFALAEILLKQTGNSSLDKARGQHAHHGLDLKLDRNPSRLEALGESAAALRAVPLVKPSGERFGTFDLWHRTSRSAPLTGESKTTFLSGAYRQGQELLINSRGRIAAPLKASGVSLLECFRLTPRMKGHVTQHNVDAGLVRARLMKETDERNKTQQTQFIIQPTVNDDWEKLSQNILFKPSGLDQLKTIELKNGCIVSWDHNSLLDAEFRMPIAFQENIKDIEFSILGQSLNEFGVYYAGIFILGNYSRYFPDLWMVDVEKSTSLMLAASDFVSAVYLRIPILTLSELSNTWNLVEL